MTDLNKLNEALAKARTEEDVKAAWANAFSLAYDTSEDHDLYTPQVLFEFKYDKALDQAAPLAAVVAQGMYYLRRLQLGESKKGIPQHFCCASKHACAIGEVIAWRDIYLDEADEFDWDLRPSSPDSALVSAVQAHPAFKQLHAMRMALTPEGQAVCAQLASLLAPQDELVFGDKKLITEDNFEDVFEYWNAVFGEAVRNGFKSSRYFVADIAKGKTQVVASEGRVYFQVDKENVKVKKILAQDYERFWRLYEKVTDAVVMRGIVAKVDRLTDDVARRKHGEFFTPLPFAKKALQYLEKELGQGWWRSGEYRVWDMAAGTGNLEYHLPAEALQYTYLSSLYKEDIEHCERLFPGATTFQYDYLNDDVGNVFAVAQLSSQTDQSRLIGLDFGKNLTWKMPEKLRQDLANTTLKWIVLINPPFATAQQGGTTGANKTGVSMTKVRQVMHTDDLGEVSRELFAQFLFRIKQDFASRTAWLGLFSKLSYVSANNDQKLRDRMFRYRFKRGFMFSSANFSGTSQTSPFPVGFLLWDLAKAASVEKQNLQLDVFDASTAKIARKRMGSVNKTAFLSKLIPRPKALHIMPPLSSAIAVKTTGSDIRDRASEHFLASLMCAGNDIQHQNQTALLSSPYASAGSHSITPAIFEQSLLVHAVRRLPKASWHNDRDQFLQPTATLPEAFINDAIVWSLYANSNNTVAMRDVPYDGQTYQIQNHFFPILLKTVRTWQHGDLDFAQQLPTAQDRFVAQWLATHPFSAEAQAVLDAGEEAFRCYFQNLNQLRTPKFKIDTWDAGWWQVRNALDDAKLGAVALNAVKLAHAALKAKLLPQVYDYGFLVE